MKIDFKTKNENNELYFLTYIQEEDRFDMFACSDWQIIQEGEKRGGFVNGVTDKTYVYGETVFTNVEDAQKIVEDLNSVPSVKIQCDCGATIELESNDGTERFMVYYNNRSRPFMYRYTCPVCGKNIDMTGEETYKMIKRNKRVWMLKE